MPWERKSHFHCPLWPTDQFADRPDKDIPSHVQFYQTLRLRHHLLFAPTRQTDYTFLHVLIAYVHPIQPNTKKAVLSLDDLKNSQTYVLPYDLPPPTEYRGQN